MKKTDFPNDCLTTMPTIDPSVFVADSATVIGDVVLSEESSVWYGAVLRGDINAISIGARTNIQDLSMLHLENDRACVVGADVTCGHRAILHGCTIEDAVLIGMGAIVLNGAVVGEGAVIGAGAVVKEETIIPPCTLWVGVPAVQVKVLDTSIIDQNKAWAAKYVQLAKKHRDYLKKDA